jgi:hypothetical protein
VNVIAIHYAPGAGEPLVVPLAEALDKTVYEARARLSSPEGGPAVVASYAEIEAAWACTGRLRANGIAPLLLTRDEVETDARRFVVRSFELGPRSLTAVSRKGETTELPYNSVDLFLRGVRVDERTDLKSTEQRKFSAGRALLTGGLMITKTTRKLEQVTTEDREDFFHLYSEGRPPMAFKARSINYQSLGPALQPSTSANFAFLLEELRRSLPQARYDERLASSQGRARVLGPGLTENHLDVAISLLARVLRKGS